MNETEDAQGAISSLGSKETISTNAEYFRIGKAAEMLGCTADDLLHMGVNYRVEIMAPVLLEGVYEWAINPLSSGYPEIIGPVRQYFDAAERVILSWTDLAKIEGIGWSIPTFFYAPPKAKEIDELLLGCLPQSLDGFELNDVMTISRNEGGVLISSVTYSPMKLVRPDEELIARRKTQYLAAWYQEKSSEENSKKTTIDHLFISRKELERLRIGQPNDASSKPDRGQVFKAPHGNIERFAAKREPVLKAAIYCIANYHEQCIGSSGVLATRLATLIDEKAALFWPVDGLPPLARQTIEEMLREALNYPDR